MDASAGREGGREGLLSVSHSLTDSRKRVCLVFVGHYYLIL